LSIFRRRRLANLSIPAVERPSPATDIVRGQARHRVRCVPSALLVRLKSPCIWQLRLPGDESPKRTIAPRFRSESGFLRTARNAPACRFSFWTKERPDRINMVMVGTARRVGKASSAPSKAGRIGLRLRAKMAIRTVCSTPCPPTTTAV
jgi:hypothetical protein